MVTKLIFEQVRCDGSIGYELFYVIKITPKEEVALVQF
jgi:hypothetical protein